MSPRNRIRWYAVSAAIAIALGQGAVATGAHAATPVSVPAARHCLWQVTTGAVACYYRFSEVVAAISGGTVTGVTDPGQVTQAVADRISAASRTSAAPIGSAPRGHGVSPALQTSNPCNVSCVVVGIFYADWHYQGSTLSAVSSSRCSGPATSMDAQVVMPAGWDNVVSSFYGYSSCLISVYDLPYPSCAWACQGPEPYAYYVGDAMNDRTSAAAFF